MVVKFPIKFSRGALLRLVDDAGVPISLGSTATLRATGTVVPVGYDGEAYVEVSACTMRLQSNASTDGTAR